MKIWARPAFQVALQRLDELIHREILRLRASYQLSLDEFRGLYISDQQVDELILQQRNLGQVDVASLTAEADQLLRPARQGLAHDRRWNILCRLYALSEFEQDVLLLAFAPELHSKYPILFAYLNNDITRKYPTVELALNLFCEQPDDDHRRSFASQGALLEKGLILPVQHQASHYSLQSGFVIAPTLREFLFGHVAMDQRLVEACQLSPPAYRDWHSWPFTASTLEPFQSFAQMLQRSTRPPYFIIEAAAASGVDELAANSLFAAGYGCCRVDSTQLLKDRDGVSDAVRSLCQSALLEHAGVLIDDLAQLLQPSKDNRVLLDLLLRQLNDAGIACFLLLPPKTPWRELLSGRHNLICHIQPPAVAQRQRFWRHHLQAVGLDAADDELAAVADYFQLDYRQVQAAANDLAFHYGLEQHAATMQRSWLFAAARRQSHGDMGELAERVGKAYQLSDLVLPNAILLRIKEIISAIKSRRLVFEQWDLQRRMGGASGIVCLFAGASGTGKTMTASVIANEIGLDLYRIELSGIVSKYIGETEKNLDRIFAAARKANCILFFDEADALFGKRSEVKDAHDRYANIEVAYLLQKIENHDGIVILTTNLAKSIDQAFTRRMQFIVEFPRPDVAHREKLWRGMFGDAVPLADDVDFNFLGRQLENTGGDIKNMVLDAALMAAASEHQVIDMALLVRAAARQMMKQGKVPSAIEFKHYFSLVDNSSA